MFESRPKRTEGNETTGINRRTFQAKETQEASVPGTETGQASVVLPLFSC